MHDGDKNKYKIFIGKPEGRNYREDIGVKRRILLKWIFGSSLGYRLDTRGPGYNR